MNIHHHQSSPGGHPTQPNRQVRKTSEGQYTASKTDTGQYSTRKTSDGQYASRKLSDGQYGSDAQSTNVSYFSAARLKSSLYDTPSQPENNWREKEEEEDHPRDRERRRYVIEQQGNDWRKDYRPGDQHESRRRGGGGGEPQRHDEWEGDYIPSDRDRGHGSVLPPGQESRRETESRHGGAGDQGEEAWRRDYATSDRLDSRSGASLKREEEWKEDYDPPNGRNSRHGGDDWDQNLRGDNAPTAQDSKRSMAVKHGDEWRRPPAPPGRQNRQGIAGPRARLFTASSGNVSLVLSQPGLRGDERIGYNPSKLYKNMSSNELRRRERVSSVPRSDPGFSDAMSVRSGPPPMNYRGRISLVSGTGPYNSKGLLILAVFIIACTT